MSQPIKGSGILTRHQIMHRMILNDARNIRDALTVADYRTHQQVASDCAARMVDAWDFGDRGLIRHCEQNLRDAVAQLPTHRAKMGEP